MNATISHRAMLARVSIRAVDFTRLDRRVSAEVNESKGASADASRTNKHLIVSPLLKEVQKVAGELRAKHRYMTLAWQDDGYRMLPAAAFPAYQQAMNALIRKYDDAVKIFIDAYPDMIEESKKRLGEMFEYKDFPHPKSLAKRFVAAVGTMPLPEGKDFRVDLGEAEVARIRGELEAQSQEALAGAVKELWTRLHKVIRHMVDRLSVFTVDDEGKRINNFKSSLVTNVQELVSVLPALNITNDPVMAELADKARRELCAHDAEDLKANDGLREKVKTSAADILAQLMDYTGMSEDELADAEAEAA